MSNTHPSFEKTTAFLRSHVLRHEDLPHASGGPFVTISRESGAGATVLARSLAERLNQSSENDPPWSIFGANLIEEMLQTNHLSPRVANYLPEARVSEVNALIGEIVGLHPNLWQLVQKTKELVRKLASDGHAIFIGRGAAFATQGLAHGVHVRLIAPKEFRAHRTAERLGISLEQAFEYIDRKDAQRRAYVKANFDAYGPDPVAYDLVINTGTIPFSEAVELIAQIVQQRRAATVER